MDLTVLAGPHPFMPALDLIIVGVLGYFALRRWRVAAIVIAPAATWLVWDLLSRLSVLLDALGQPTLRGYVLPDFVLGVVALLLGIGLPVLAWTQRSRRTAAASAR